MLPNNDLANSSLNSSSASHKTMSLLNVTDSLFLEQQVTIQPETLVYLILCFRLVI